MDVDEDDEDDEDEDDDDDTWVCLNIEEHYSSHDHLFIMIGIMMYCPVHLGVFYFQTSRCDV